MSCWRCFAVLLPLICSTTAWSLDPGASARGLPVDGSGPTAAGPRTTVVSSETGDFCITGPETLCLAQDRFSVEVEWTDFAGDSGPGSVLPFQSDDSGLLWFFDSDNWEMLVKVLDGCSLNQRFWVFAAASTDVEYTLRITDHAAGVVREYFNPLGTAAPALTDTDAFPTCDVVGGRPSLLLFANPSTLPVGGTSLLTVIARDADGDPAGPGQRIELETDLGSVPTEIFTDADGEAEVLFSAGDLPGRATVTAVLDASEPASVELTILEVPDAQLLILASPSIISVGGTSQITVIARDTQGTPLGGGRRIRLVADLGALDSEEVFTDDLGEAAAVFSAGPLAGSGTVTAIMSGSEPVQVLLAIRDAPAALSLQASPAVIPRMPGGITVELTASILNAQGLPFPNHPVQFESERGFLDSGVDLSNSLGVAETLLMVRAIDVEDIPEGGSFRVTATVLTDGNVLRDVVTLTVLGAP